MDSISNRFSNSNDFFHLKLMFFLLNVSIKDTAVSMAIPKFILHCAFGLDLVTQPGSEFHNLQTPQGSN
jgi:hypothetical protein